MDLPAGFLVGNEAALLGGFHSLLEDTAGCGINFNFRLVRNKCTDALHFAHAFNVPDFAGERNANTPVRSSPMRKQRDPRPP